MKWFVAALVMLPTAVLGQDFTYGFSGSSGGKHTQGITVCAFGDSITQGGDWFTPLTDIGIQVIDIGDNGSFERTGGTVNDDGEEVTTVCTVDACVTPGPSCQDAFGFGVESVCLADLLSRCTVGVNFYGTNDVGEGDANVWDRDGPTDCGGGVCPGPKYETALTNVLNEFELRGIPVVVVRPIPRMGSPIEKGNLIETALGGRIEGAIATAAYQDVTYVDAWGLWDSYRRENGDTLFFQLYDDCQGEETGGDCTHPERVVPNDDGLLGADFLGEAIKGAVLGLVRAQ